MESLEVQNHCGVNTYEFLFADEECCALFASPESGVKGCLNNAIAVGSATGEEVDLYELYPNTSHLGLRALRAPYRVLLALQEHCGYQTYKAYESARTCEKSGMLSLRAQCLSTARKWSTMEMSLMRAVSFIRGRGL